MKNLLRLTLIIGLAIGGFSTITAQDYNSAVGLRLGVPVSVSYKTFLGGGSNAFEAFASYRKRSFYSSYDWTRIGVGAGYQIHKDIASVDGLMWYFGAGASVYFWNFSNSAYFDNSNTTSFGLLGFLGLDYSFANVPVNVSIDWVPVFFLNGYGNGFGADSGALSVRYIISR